MKKLIIIIFILLSVNLFSKEKYYILLEKDFSAYVGAEDLLTVHKGFQMGANRALSFKNRKGVMYGFGRLLELSFLWGPLARLEMTVQHEIFGHGYRIRDLGSSIARVSKYKIDMPFPYGNGGGRTHYYYSNSLTAFQEAAISIAGVEATAILANRLKMKWMHDLKIDPQKAALYVEGQQDLTAYVYSMNNSSFFVNEGHDIESYLYWLNLIYYNTSLSKDTLKNAAVVNLLDPTTWYCIAAYFYYVFRGKDMPIFTINIKNVHFLPNLRLGLAPYGLEYYLENFFSFSNRTAYSYLRMGEHNDRFYWGLGLEMPDIYQKNRFGLGFRLDTFGQPKIYSKAGLFTTDDNIQIGYTLKDQKKIILGFSAYLILDKRFNKKSDFSFHADLGYKTNGFIQGQALGKSVIFRVGIGL